MFFARVKFISFLFQIKSKTPYFFFISKHLLWEQSKIKPLPHDEICQHIVESSTKHTGTDRLTEPMADEDYDKLSRFIVKSFEHSYVALVPAVPNDLRFTAEQRVFLLTKISKEINLISHSISEHIQRHRNHTPSVRSQAFGHQSFNAKCQELLTSIETENIPQESAILQIIAQSAIFVPVATEDELLLQDADARRKLRNIFATRLDNYFTWAITNLRKRSVEEVPFKILAKGDSYADLADFIVEFLDALTAMARSVVDHKAHGELLNKIMRITFDQIAFAQVKKY